MATKQDTLFTPEKANLMLPLVRRIVGDIVEEFTRMRDAGRKRRELEVESSESPDPSVRNQIEALKQEVNERSIRIDGYLKETGDLGIEVKDLEQGIIDFPTERKGKPACLCWKHGEEHVAYWHGTGETFKDRKPVVPNEFNR